MEKEMLFTIFLAVLVLVAGAEAVQLVKLNNAVKTGSVKLSGSGSASSAGSSGGQSQLPGNLQNLPSMVGGC